MDLNELIKLFPKIIIKNIKKDFKLEMKDVDITISETKDISRFKVESCLFSNLNKTFYIITNEKN